MTPTYFLGLARILAALAAFAPVAAQSVVAGA
jgi:hypothetical protein